MDYNSVRVVCCSRIYFNVLDVAIVQVGIPHRRVSVDSFAPECIEGSEQLEDVSSDVVVSHDDGFVGGSFPLQGSLARPDALPGGSEERMNKIRTNKACVMP